ARRRKVRSWSPVVTARASSGGVRRTTPLLRPIGAKGRRPARSGWPPWAPSTRWIASNRRAVSGGADKTVRVWDLTARKELQCFEGHTAEVQQVDVSSDGEYAMSRTANVKPSAKELAIVWRLPDEPGPTLPTAGAP